nr:reverse transcriptase domain-containing protein [Tanacetum cinerariifolium]
MSDCPKLKDQNRGNKAENKNEIGETRGKSYVLGGGDAIPDSDVVKDVSYDVELANERISKTKTIFRGCTLGLLGHPLNIDLMPVQIGSFDVIIDMDWLANHHAMIIYDEKIMRIPYGDEVLIKETEDKSKEKRLEDVLTVWDFLEVYLAQVTSKKVEDKSKEKRIKDVPIVQEFSEVFPEDLPGLLPARQVEFQINLVPSTPPVA